MDPTVVLFKAIQRLRPNAKFSCHEGIVKEWHDETITIPTEQEIEEEKQKVIAEFNSVQYQRERVRVYPNLADQLDMLWHAIDQNKLDTTSDFYQSLKAVKDKYPKGS